MYGKEYASPLRSLRPSWKTFLNILQAIPSGPVTSHGSWLLTCQNSFSTVW
jgi:hypothetical protein